MIVSTFKEMGEVVGRGEMKGRGERIKESVNPIPGIEKSIAVLAHSERRGLSDMIK